MKHQNIGEKPMKGLRVQRIYIYMYKCIYTFTHNFLHAF